ncbi:MAG: FecR domain-containing protein [Deltaproteobacteria bacterium]|nr:FecR domain-containing protein [Deltaproteobacteria bacterium]
MKSKSKKMYATAILFVLFLITLLSGPALSANRVIATMTDFSGNVLIRSQGSWDIEPRKGIPLYSDDKVVTRTGSATINFEDGAIIQIENNSNLKIQEQVPEKGILTRAGDAKRKLRLLLGKIIFKTGTSGIQTNLETPTMVCGLRGTEGILSLDENGQPYIQFYEGGPAFTIGEFISGVAADVPPEIANQNPVQRAALIAKIATDQAKEAAAKAATGEATQADLALAQAKAAEAAALETQAELLLIIENNPDPELIEEANEVLKEVEEAIKEAQEAIQEAIDAGAEPTPEPEPEPEEEPLVIPPEEEPPIEDNQPASPV